MSSFHITQIIATGKNVSASSLKFTEGLNIICGPSNTGKSYVRQCIDFMFGGGTKPFDEETTGFDTVTMLIETKDEKNITLRRQLGKNITEVSSNVPGIESGKYGGGQSKLKLSGLWLSLIGINEEVSIVSNQYFQSHILTWRTFLYSFLISEDDVFQKPSIITKAGYYEKTASLSALLYLMSGKDFSQFATHDTPEVQKARKKAKSDYINEKLSEFTERYGKLADSMASLEGVDIEAQMQELIDRIAIAEESIAVAAKRSRKLLEETYTVSGQLEESDYLQDRYKSLETQYLSDLKRLRFILDGEMQSGDQGPNPRCPFCDSDLPEHEHITYLEASEKEHEGKGFRAFLNTAMAFNLMRYLVAHGKYAPGLLVIDSPILSLKEKGKEKATDSMKSSLFRYLLNNQQYGQVIIIENDIPELDYSTANVIRFTMDENEGRYGFLTGVHN